MARTAAGITSGYISNGFNAVKNNLINSYRPYTYDLPFIVTPETAVDLQQLGRVIEKILRTMVAHHRDYLDVIPRSKRELEIMEICARHPYRTGTFRTDFVIDKNNAVKIIEINAGHPFNGIFTSGIFNEIARRQAEELRIDGIADYYSPVFEYIEKYIGKSPKITVIYGREPAGDRNIYNDIFNAAGMPCHLIPLAELEENLIMLEDSWIILELLGDEISGLSDDTLDVLAKNGTHNSLLPLIHSGSKKVFRAFGHPRLIDAALHDDERTLLQKFLTPTYILGFDDDMWNEAYHNKDGFIIKHHFKGRGEDIYAGRLTGEAEWKRLFDGAVVRDMVLQPYIEQPLFTGTIGTEQRNDFVTGTLLYFNEQFFGPGFFRAHAAPISSPLGDFRKIAQLVAPATMDGVHCI